MNKLLELTKSFALILLWLGVVWIAMFWTAIFSEGEALASLGVAVYGIFLVYVINTLKRIN